MKLKKRFYYFVRVILFMILFILAGVKLTDLLSTSLDNVNALGDDILYVPTLALSTRGDSQHNVTMRNKEYIMRFFVMLDKKFSKSTFNHEGED